MSLLIFTDVPKPAAERWLHSSAKGQRTKAHNHDIHAWSHHFTCSPFGVLEERGENPPGQLHNMQITLTLVPKGFEPWTSVLWSDTTTHRPCILDFDPDLLVIALEHPFMYEALTLPFIDFVFLCCLHLYFHELKECPLDTVRVCSLCECRVRRRLGSLSGPAAP